MAGCYPIIVFTLDVAEAMNLTSTKGAVIWFYGLSGSGKSTISKEVAAELAVLQIPFYVLDGDVLRKGLCRDLSMSPEDRRENIRRAAHVARILADAGLVVLSAFITPYNELRRLVRSILTGFPYCECYLECGVSTCRTRDPKGLYTKADAGLIPEFTGVSAPFEPPEKPDLTICTEKLTIEQSVQEVMEHIMATGMLDGFRQSDGFSRVDKVGAASSPDATMNLLKNGSR